MRLLKIEWAPINLLPEPFFCSRLFAGTISHGDCLSMKVNRRTLMIASSLYMNNLFSTSCLNLAVEAALAVRDGSSLLLSLHPLVCHKEIAFWFCSFSNRLFFLCFKYINKPAALFSNRVKHPKGAAQKYPIRETIPSYSDSRPGV
jgi:hypothetical protein